MYQPGSSYNARDEEEIYMNLKDRGFTRVCEVDEVGSPMPKLVEVADRGILICREGEELFAVDELCPHENKSMRYGIVFDGVLTCPHHQYRFDLETGDCNKRRCAPAITYPLEIDGDEVWVKVGNG